ncbi:MAG TPA: hypothetical protein VF625_15845 [Longimicrobium sp.]|jgi:hypothetical protein
MTELQLPKAPHHPDLHRAAEKLGTVALVAMGITLPIIVAEWMGWIGPVSWLVPAVRVSLTLIALAEALKRLSTVRPDSLTRRMRQILAVLLPLIAAFLDPDHFPADAALAAFAAFGVAYTVDTQTGFRAWSLRRWIATVGSLGFALYVAGAVVPDPLSWAVSVAAVPLLMAAFYSVAELWVNDRARDEDGAPAVEPAALTGAPPLRSHRTILDDPT